MPRTKTHTRYISRGGKLLTPVQHYKRMAGFVSVCIVIPLPLLMSPILGGLGLYLAKNMAVPVAKVRIRKKEFVKPHPFALAMNEALRGELMKLVAVSKTIYILKNGYFINERIHRVMQIIHRRPPGAVDDVVVPGITAKFRIKERRP